MRQNRFFQQGVGLPAAIFVITVMAVLTVAINRLVRQNAETFEEELRVTRALHAASSGADFGLHTLYPPEEHPDYTNGSCPGQASPTLYSFTVDGLNSCSAEVYCEEDATVDDTTYYTVTSAGTCGEVIRTLTVRTGN